MVAVLEVLGIHKQQAQQAEMVLKAVAVVVLASQKIQYQMVVLVELALLVK
jgi:hypothetical protein